MRLLLIFFISTSSLGITDNKKNSFAWEQLYREGTQLEKAGANAEAISKYETSLKIAQDSGDQQGIAKNWLALGRMKSEAGKYQEATKLLENSKELGEQIGDKKIVAESLIEISDQYIDQSKYKESMEIGQQAFRIAAELNDNEILSRAYRNLGNNLFYQGLFTQAREFYEKGLKHAEETIDPTLICHSLHVLANTLNRIGDTNQSIQYFQRAIQKAHQAGNKIMLPRIHSGLANSYEDQGSYELATEHFLLALNAVEDVGNKSDKAMVLNNLGNLTKLQGSFDQALSYYYQALQIAEEIKNLRGVAIVLNNLGALYADEGLPEKALDYHLRALQTREQIGDRWGMTSSLNNIGLFYEKQKQYDRAIEYQKKSIKIAEEIGDKPKIALLTHNLGEAYFYQGSHEEAEKQYQRSLSLATQINLKEFIGFSSEGMGKVCLKLHKLPQAAEYFHKALSLGEDLTFPKLIWLSCYGLAKVYEEMGDNRQAIHFYQAAIDEIEKVRSTASSEEGKSGFLASNFAVYEDFIGLLYRLGKKYPDRNYDAEAFDYSERAKARALLDTLAEFRSGVRKGLTKEQVQLESSILKKISRLQSQLWEESKEQKQIEVKKRLQEVEAELDGFILDLKLKNPEYAQLKYPEPYDLNKTQKQLDGNTALLEFFLGEMNSYVFAVNSSAVQVASLPSRAKLDELVRTYRERISKSPTASVGLNANSLQQEYQQQARALFQQLIAPVQQVISGKQNLILVLDGVLHYVPFETLLMDGNHLMIENFKIVYAPSVTIWANLKAKPKQQNSKELIAFGDPIVPSKSSNSDNTEESWLRHLGSLRYARQEVEGIASLFAQNSVGIYLGKEATESKFKIKEILDYEVIHFATHAMIDEEMPRRSGVILSPDPKDTTDGILQMHEIWNLRLNAQLVVLSACETGLGKLVTGEGMVSLMRAFFYAGAKNVVVSLWNVDDKSTADLMKGFYIHMKSGKSQAESMRQAKLDMIRAANSDSGYAAYQYPYYWAPFVLVGVGN